jgi:hypothetical protein
MRRHYLNDFISKLRFTAEILERDRNRIRQRNISHLRIAFYQRAQSYVPPVYCKGGSQLSCCPFLNLHSVRLCCLT